MSDEDGVPLMSLRRRSSSQSLHDENNINSGSTSKPRHLGTGGILDRLRQYEDLLDRKFGLEAESLERILPEDRHNPGLWVMPLVWVGATLNLSGFVAGLLGWELGLSFRQSFWAILWGTVTGSAVVGWCAILGPQTGLRQVAISRYSLGWYFSKVVAVLNLTTNLGFSAVSCIAAGYALTALTNNRVSPSYGIVLTSFSATFFSLFGLKGVLLYERYAWVMGVFLFATICVQTVPVADITTLPSTAGLSGGGSTINITSASLALFSVSYGQCGGWASITSDFYVHYSAKTSPTTTFLLTTLGLTTSNLFAMTAGALVASTMSSNSAWLAAYNSPGGVGALIHTVLHPRLFADVILMLFVLSGIGMNCMTIYSGTISLQQISAKLCLVPRFIWSFVFFASILAIGILGREHLLPLLQNLLASLGYWNTAFFFILFAEHHIFRRGDMGQYNLDAWDDASRLPVGLAGGTAFTFATLASIAGMHESWYVGPLARHIGGDVGNMAAGVVAIFLFIPLRIWEKRLMGR